MDQYRFSAKHVHGRKCRTMWSAGRRMVWPRTLTNRSRQVNHPADYRMPNEITESRTEKEPILPICPEVGIWAFQGLPPAGEADAAAPGGGSARGGQDGTALDQALAVLGSETKQCWWLKTLHVLDKWQWQHPKPSIPLPTDHPYFYQPPPWSGVAGTRQVGRGGFWL